LDASTCFLAPAWNMSLRFAMQHMSCMLCAIHMRQSAPPWDQWRNSVCNQQPHVPLRQDLQQWMWPCDCPNKFGIDGGHHPVANFVWRPYVQLHEQSNNTILHV
jgi:hypothetical protein